MAKQIRSDFIAKKRIRRPGRHKKKLNRRSKPKNYFG